MAAPTHLLVAVDFNEISEHALARALDLAADLHARVTLLHVYSLPSLRVGDSDLLPSADEAARVTAEAERGLDKLVTQYARPGVTMERLLRTGRPPAEEICASAREIGADLIVVGTHGRGAIGRALLGSVAMDVLRTAEVPVMSVHEKRS